MPTLSTNNLVGVTYYVVHGPQYYFHFQDSEPFQIPTNEKGQTVYLLDYIRGGFTAPPKLGYALWFALVGKRLSISAMGAAAGVTVSNWGDGTGAGDSSTSHIYTVAGGYWVSALNTGGQVAAVRFVRVVAEGTSIPASLEGTAQGTTENGFGIRLSMQLDALDVPDSAFAGPRSNALIREGTAIGIFTYAPNWADTTVMGDTHIVAGGFASDISAQLTPAGRIYNFTAYGPSYWLLQSFMREQAYMDPAVLDEISSLGPGVVKVDGKDPLSTDVFHEGYLPNHFMKCLPTVTALHVLQHVQIGAVWDAGGSTHSQNPLLSPNPGYVATKEYGTLAQFMNVEIDDSTFYETSTGSIKGYQGYGVADGQVLSNIRQLLDNEGWRFYERHDMTACFERRPQYRFDQTFAAAAMPTWNYHYPINHQPPGGAATQQEWYDYYSALYFYGWYRGNNSSGVDIFPDPATDQPGAPTAAQLAAYDQFFNAPSFTLTGIWYYIYYVDQQGKQLKVAWPNFKQPSLGPATTSTFNPLAGKTSAHQMTVADLGAAAGGVIITRNLQQHIRQVIVDQPTLALVIAGYEGTTGGWRPPMEPWLSNPLIPGLHPTNPKANWILLNWYDLQSLVIGGPILGGYFNDNAMIVDPRNPSSDKADTGTTRRAEWNAGMAAMFAYFNITSDTAPGADFIDAPELQQKEDPEQFLVRYPNPARAFGKTLGPLKNVYTLSALVYAMGRDKEERLKWGVTLPVGETFGVGLGDVIALTHSDTNLGISWSGKLFDVLSMDMLLNSQGEYFGTLQLLEIDPGEPTVVTSDLTLETSLTGT